MDSLPYSIHPTGQSGQRRSSTPSVQYQRPNSRTLGGQRRRSTPSSIESDSAQSRTPEFINAPGPGCLTRFALRVARAIGAPYLKIIGGTLIVLGFATTVFGGIGFFVGCGGAGLLLLSTSGSCIDDAAKPIEEKEGQVNVLAKSAGWATIGSILLIPYWISGCMDCCAGGRSPSPNILTMDIGHYDVKDEHPQPRVGRNLADEFEPRQTPELLDESMGPPLDQPLSNSVPDQSTLTKNQIPDPRSGDSTQQFNLESPRNGSRNFTGYAFSG